MQTVRVESRNTEGRVVSVLEKDFHYITKRDLSNWFIAEILTAIHGGWTITIRRIDNE